MQLIYVMKYMLRYTIFLTSVAVTSNRRQNESITAINTYLHYIGCIFFSSEINGKLGNFSHTQLSYEKSCAKTTKLLFS